MKTRRARSWRLVSSSQVLLLLAAVLLLQACDDGDIRSLSYPAPPAYVPFAPTRVDLVAGSTVTGSADGTGAAATFQLPQGVAVVGGGYLLVSDTANHTIRRIAPGGVVTTIAGAVGVAGSTDGLGSAARFNLPSGMASDGAGNVFLADRGNNTIRKLAPNPDGTYTVSTIAGQALTCGYTEGTGSSAQFCTPFRITIDPSGNLFVSDNNSAAVRKLTRNPDGTYTVSTIAGGLIAGTADGTGSGIQFVGPIGIAIDPAGNLYVSDASRTIRKLTPNPDGTYTSSTIAGLANTAGFADGTGSAALFNNPQGLAFVDGVLYVADLTNRRVRAVTPDGVVSTLAGSVAGQVYGPLPGQIDAPSALAYDPVRNALYVTTSLTVLVIH